MKKICYVVTVPITIRAFFIPQLKYLAEHGFEVHVICSEDQELQGLLGEKIKYIPLNMPRGISVGGTVQSIKRLVTIFKQEQYDLVQYSTPNAALYASIAARIVKCRVRNYHCMGFRYLGFRGVMRYIFKQIEKLTCNMSTDIECVSKSNMELGVEEKLFTREKATVVFNGSTGGIDLKKFDIVNKESWRKEVRGKYDLDENDWVYGFVGRINRDKGINDLLEAFFLMNNNSKLLLVGEIEKNSYLDVVLLEKARKSEKIIFAGKIEAVEKYYAAMDVLILPSYREGFGNVIIEAESMGIPVISSNIPGPQDTMEANKTGYLIERGNIKELIEKMKRIKDISIYEDFSKNACKFAKSKFDSRILNECILERKELLIGERNEN